MPDFVGNTAVSLNACVHTPVNIPRLRSVLSSHPDRGLIDHVLRGLTFGFNLGVESAMGPGSCSNNFSALNNKKLVSVALRKELANGCISGPYVSPRSFNSIVPP